MKEFFLKTAALFKRVKFYYRLAGIVLAYTMITSIALPDLQFNMASDKPVEMTLDQLFKTPKADLPRYLKIKDAVVPSGSYIETRKSKTNTLQEIYYPVYPSATTKSKLDMTKLDSLKKVINTDSLAFKVTSDSSGNYSILHNTDRIEARLVIHDTHVTDKELDSTYFSSPDFSIEGQYKGTDLPNDIKSLLTRENIKISDDVIMLNRGDQGMSTFAAIGLILGAFFVGLFCILSFVPDDTLARFAGYNSMEEAITANATILPANITVAPMGKRIVAFVIDYGILWAIFFALSINLENNVYLVWLPIVFIYFMATDIAMHGSSIGKMVVRQKITPVDGDLSTKDIIIRNLIKTLSNAFPFIFLYALGNDAKQTIHDLIAKTVVVEKESNVI